MHCNGLGTNEHWTLGCGRVAKIRVSVTKIIMDNVQKFGTIMTKKPQKFCKKISKFMWNFPKICQIWYPRVVTSGSGSFGF